MNGGDAGGVQVHRTDDTLGLAVERAGRSGRTLVTYARDHVTVRTPSRPDFRDGNAIDLLAPPGMHDLDRWIARFRDTIAVLGVRHVQLRWEEPLPADAPPGGTARAGAPGCDPALLAALEERGFAVDAVTVLLLDDLVAPGTVAQDVEVAPVPAPSAVPGGAVDRRWHAASVLYRYEHGDTPDDWRSNDEDFTRWSVDVQRELVAAGRASVWVATRHGAPVGRATLTHDRQGLAVLEDVIVHPLHRRRGVASLLTHRAVTDHLARHPGTRVGLAAVPGSGAERLYRRLGFRPHATVWSALSLGELTTGT